jgi:hypothetical protein
MRLQRQSSGQVLQFDTRATLGAGGEALVFAVPGEAQIVAKVYRRPMPEHASKLASMLANPPVDPMAAQGHVSIAWPVDMLYTADGTRRIVGFVMPRADGERALIEFYNPTARRQQCPLFNYLYLHRTARNLASAVRAVHHRGYVIGDLNEMNILVTDTALVTLVDCDSFQVRDVQSRTVHRCPVGRPEFTPPELQGKTFRDLDRNPEHDLFGLGVLIFQLLMEGTHPFAGVYTGEGEPPPYEARIMRGEFPYGSRPVPYRVMPAAPPFRNLHPRLQELFLRCFEEGHSNPQARPDAETWVTALQAAEDALAECAVNDQHRYGSHLDTCPWCERTQRLRGRDPFPSRQAVESGTYAGSQASVQTALPSVGRPTLPPMPTPTFQHAQAAVAAPVVTAPVAPASMQHEGPGIGRWVAIGALVLGTGAAAVGVNSYVSHQKTVAATATAARARQAKLAEAEGERNSADTLLKDVTRAIERFKRETLTEAQVDQIKAELRTKLEQAQSHATRSIELDPQNAQGWVLKVRALRISGDEDGAKSAVKDALQKFPGNRDLLEQRDLL